MEKSKVIRVVNLALAAILATAGMAEAGPLRVRGEIGYTADWNTDTSFDADFGFQDRQSYNGNLRLLWDGNAGALSFDVQAILAFEQGDNLDYANALAGMFPAPPPDTFFDLSYENADGSLAFRIDRLSVGYASDHLVLKLGRQAVTWGRGMIFHPTDIVAPFSPNALDTTYKPGVDMVYAQYLFDSGADIEAIYVPRPAVAGGRVDWDSSTVALHATMMLGDLDGTLMLGMDRGDTVISASLSGPLGGAAWNVEYAHWFVLDGTEERSTFLANISSFGTLFDHNIVYFAEYFHNGFGVASDVPLDALPPELSGRLSTGNLFNTGRDFLAIGVQYSLNPAMTISPNAIVSLNDGSALLGVQASWSIDDNMDLMIGYFQPVGADGTEFGGREITLGSPVFMRPPTEFSIKLSRFF